MNIKNLLFGKSLPPIKTSGYQNSTQKWLPIADIKNGVILTTDGRFVKILEVMPVNFYLKSLMEQQNIIFYFSSYLKVAPDTMQIKTVTQKADIDGYISRMWAFHENEPVDGCRDMIEDNIREMRYLAANEALTRRFFLIFQHEPRMKVRQNTIEGIAERLREEEQTARRYLDMCGLEVRYVDYSDNFQLELLYALINKRTSHHARLSSTAFEMTGMVNRMADDDVNALLQEEGEHAGKKD